MVWLFLTFPRMRRKHLRYELLFRTGGSKSEHGYFTLDVLFMVVPFGFPSWTAMSKSIHSATRNHRFYQGKFSARVPVLNATKRVYGILFRRFSNRTKVATLTKSFRDAIKNYFFSDIIVFFSLLHFLEHVLGSVPPSCEICK